MEIKLSKQQAKLLIRSLALYSGRVNNTVPGSEVVAWTQIVAIINRHTEKEFPGFEMKWNDKDDIAHWVKVSLEDGEVEVQCDCAEYYLYFGCKEFKEFTQGCNKIVEWMGEQEQKIIADEG